MAMYIGRLLELLSDLFVQAFVNPWQMTQSIVFHSNPTTPTGNRPKRKRRSIVRMIGSNLPLPSAPRVYLNLAAWNSCAHSYTSSIAIQEQIPEQDQLEIITEDVVTETDGGNGDTQAAIKSLQEELKQLRMQITAILENQSNTVKDGFKDVSVLTDSEDELRPRNKLSAPPSPPPMPPAPPPPPPLPPAALTVTQSIPIMKKSVSKNNSLYKNTPPSAMQILGQVLSEMKNGRPKLRPVQRSPGGGPLKISKPKTDPSDVLTEVLKRRFSVAQMSDTNESSDTSHTDIASSPDWKTCVT
ncbi:hypothetical protein O3M35_002481 [Rhynocoris fuscipes]|uniref:Mitochondrial fission regulator 2 n=1 Tax=Rhynocoris fuscipes TaxID=488301 RepID=A0AAW1CT47_9HEMI